MCGGQQSGKAPRRSRGANGIVAPGASPFAIVFAVLWGRQWPLGRWCSHRRSGPTTSIIPNLAPGSNRWPILTVRPAVTVVMLLALRMWIGNGL
jgi:hypothetical protein